MSSVFKTHDQNFGWFREFGFMITDSGSVKHVWNCNMWPSSTRITHSCCVWFSFIRKEIHVVAIFSGCFILPEQTVTIMDNTVCSQCSMWWSQFSSCSFVIPLQKWFSYWLPAENKMSCLERLPGDDQTGSSHERLDELQIVQPGVEYVRAGQRRRGYIWSGGRQRNLEGTEMENV